MKHFILLILMSTISLFTVAQKSDSTGRFGFTINSSFNGEIYPILIMPSLVYFKGKSQFELGFGMHPFIRKDQRILSSEFNYKYYPNGINNKFNLYLITRLSYVNNKKDTYFPTSYNYLFLNGGYGLEIKNFRNAYVGTNISIGTFTYNKDSTNPYDTFAANKMFEEFGFALAFQFNIGYRF
ncbi:MAG: hypothetical protein ACSHXL_04415 [Bacteroidota bacterium]